MESMPTLADSELGAPGVLCWGASAVKVMREIAQHGGGICECRDALSDFVSEPFKATTLVLMIVFVAIFRAVAIIAIVLLVLLSHIAFQFTDDGHISALRASNNASVGSDFDIAGKLETCIAFQVVNEKLRRH